MTSRDPSASGRSAPRPAIFPRPPSWRSLLPFLSVIAGICTASLLPAAITTSLTTHKQVVQEIADGGDATTEWVTFDSALPGDLIRYTIEYANSGDEPAGQIQVHLPIPAEMTLVPGSEKRAGLEVTYSLDGGQSYGTLASLTVTGPDGAVRPATIDEINALRWTIQQALPPAAEDQVQCLLRLK